MRARPLFLAPLKVQVEEPVAAAALVTRQGRGGGDFAILAFVRVRRVCVTVSQTHSVS